MSPINVHRTEWKKKYNEIRYNFILFCCLNKLILLFHFWKAFINPFFRKYYFSLMLCKLRLIKYYWNFGKLCSLNTKNYCIEEKQNNRVNDELSKLRNKLRIWWPKIVKKNNTKPRCRFTFDSIEKIVPCK